MKHSLHKFIVPSLLLIVSVATSCVKGTTASPAPGVVTADVIIDAATKTAWGGGSEITGQSVFACGVTWSTANATPTVADTKTSDTIINYTFTSKVTGIAPGGTYYFRAYASNPTTTSYGDVVKLIVPSALTTTYADVTKLAGGTTAGFVNGSGSAALFNKPAGAAADAAGNIYIADSFNNAIRKITPAGVVTTYAGTGQVGYKDGPGAAAQFYVPADVVVDSKGNLFVADKGNNIIRKITPAGVVSTFAGNGSAGYVNSTGADASFNTPTAIAVDGADNLYVTDNGNNRIRKITSGGVVSTFAGTGTAGYLNGDIAYATFNKPTGIAADASGNVYVAEPVNSVIRKIAVTGMVTTYAGGAINKVLVGKASSLAIDKAGNLYITDADGRVLSINKDKVLHVLAGKTGTTGAVNGNGTAASFNNPQGIAVAADGSVYVGDYNNNQVRKLSL
jgi:streptogramin lyase